MLLLGKVDEINHRPHSPTEHFNISDVPTVITSLSSHTPQSQRNRDVVNWSTLCVLVEYTYYSIAARSYTILNCETAISQSIHCYYHLLQYTVPSLSPSLVSQTLYTTQEKGLEASHTSTCSSGNQ